MWAGTMIFSEVLFILAWYCSASVRDLHTQYYTKKTPQYIGTVFLPQSLSFRNVSKPPELGAEALLPHKDEHSMHRFRYGEGR